jgi:sugar phosphate isomerase/epimerase
MRAHITSIDYNLDWILKERNFHSRPTPGSLTREEVIAYHGTLGLDGIELMHPYWEDVPAADIRRLAAQAGLPIACYLFFVDLIGPASAERRAGLDAARALLDRAAELGAPKAMIVAATRPAEGPLAQQRGWLVAGLRACAEHAQSVGVTLLAENIDFPPLRPLMGLAAQCRDLCAEVASPAFRLIYDAAATLLVEEEPLAALQAMAPNLAHVHVKNFRLLAPGEQAARTLTSAGGRAYTGTRLGAGVIDYKPIMAALARLGYAGQVLLEYQGVEDPRQALPHSLAYLRQLISAAEESNHE